ALTTGCSVVSERDGFIARCGSSESESDGICPRSTGMATCRKGVVPYIASIPIGITEATYIAYPERCLFWIPHHAAPSVRYGRSGRGNHVTVSTEYHSTVDHM